jgi:hypothetical protein
MSLSTRQICITFAPCPYTFCKIEKLQQVWDAPELKDCGIYLWCIEYQGAYLVYYVGKTTGKRGFEGRLWTELRDWRGGRCWIPVDLEAFKIGKRIVMPHISPNQLKNQLEALEPLYRIILAPILEKSDCLKVETPL